MQTFHSDSLCMKNPPPSIGDETWRDVAGTQAHLPSLVPNPRRAGPKVTLGIYPGQVFDGLWKQNTAIFHHMLAASSTKGKMDIVILQYCALLLLYCCHHYLLTDMQINPEHLKRPICPAWKSVRPWVRTQWHSICRKVVPCIFWSSNFWVMTYWCIAKN